MIGGQTVITNGVFTAATITTPLGNTLAITGYDATTGVVSYNYTLLDNETHAAGAGENALFEDFSVVLTDNDGDVANGTLSARIVDDVPVAAADTDTIAAGLSGSANAATGNVITDAAPGDAGDTDTGADTLGADGAVVTSIVATTAAGAATVVGTNTVVNGQYGVLTISATGDYSYVRNAGSPGGVSDVFTYTLTDGDGDAVTAPLTISIADTTPQIGDLTPAANGGDVTVDEDDLPARGVGESEGSDPTKESTTQGGGFTISAPDGVQTLVIGGQTVITNGVFTAATITTPLGNTLAITGYDATTGVVSYNYTLLDNETHAAGAGENALFEDFSVVLTDNDGDVANGTLSARIVDDVPVAAADTDTIAAGLSGSANAATGNVITDAAPGDAGDTDTGADTLGADGAVVTSIVATTAAGAATVVGTNTVVNGQYGVLTISATGDYSYVRNAGSPGGVSDVFTYTLTDGDGDAVTAPLTISIADTTPQIGDLTPAANGGDVTVDEDDLPARGVGESEGSDPTKESTTQGGGFTISAPDGVQTLVIGGQTVITNGVFTAATITTPLGNTLAITGYDATTGVVSYNYTLLDNETHAAGAGENALFEDFSVVLTDNDGDVANGTLSARIVDDVPVAAADTDTIAAGLSGSANAATGNVITDAAPGDAGDTDTGADTLGADGAVVTSIVATTAAGAATVVGTNTVVNGQYGVLTISATGDYSYVRNAGSPGGVSDVFTYTLTDGDGDAVTAPLTISIADTTPQIGDCDAGGEWRRRDGRRGRPPGPRGWQVRGFGPDQGEHDPGRRLHDQRAGQRPDAGDRGPDGDHQRGVHGGDDHDAAWQHACDHRLRRDDRGGELQLHAAGQRDACGWGRRERAVRGLQRRADRQRRRRRQRDAVGQDRRRCAGCGSGHGHDCGGAFGLCKRGDRQRDHGCGARGCRRHRHRCGHAGRGRRGGDVDCCDDGGRCGDGGRHQHGGERAVWRPDDQRHRRLFVCAQRRFAGRCERRVHLHADRR